MVPVRVSWDRGGWRRGTATGGRARRAGGGGALVSCGVGGSRLGCLTCLGSGCTDNVRRGQVSQPRGAQGECRGDAHPRGHLWLLGVLGAGDECVDLRASWTVACAPTRGTDRTALGGSGGDCGAVQTDVAQGQPPHCLGGEEAGHKKVWPCGQNGCTHGGHGVMRRMEATRKAVERYRRGGRPCNRAGPAGAGGVARQPQTSKHVRCEGRATAWTLMGVESTQVQWRDHVDDEACHMVRRQTCAEHDGGIEGCFVIGGCAFSAHVPSVRCVSACGQRVLSNRLLDQKNKVIGINTVSVGSLTASICHPREIYKPAILSNAASIICGHNHPSGDCQPSREDRALTTRLVEAGKLLGIAVLDHIIVGDGTSAYFSFADEGLLGAHPVVL